MQFQKASTITICLVLLGSGIVLGAYYSDPSSLYSVQIPDGWIYQVKESNELLKVFYGENSHELLYFEQLNNVFDSSPLAFAQRSLELYAERGGLKDFKLEHSPKKMDVNGLPAVRCTYTYKDVSGVQLKEHRVFLLLSKNRGFSITLSGEANWDEGSSFFEQILEYWRWLHEE